MSVTGTLEFIVGGTMILSLIIVPLAMFLWWLYVRSIRKKIVKFYDGIEEEKEAELKETIEEC